MKEKKGEAGAPHLLLARRCPGFENISMFFKSQVRPGDRSADFRMNLSILCSLSPGLFICLK